MSESISGTGLAGGILTGASVYGLLTCISSDLNWLLCCSIVGYCIF
ncbi:TPA_asm: hypothetical protein G4I87_003005 [Salmonella enterica subsp. enterica serovar Thompson]|nr:hypothetical protein [Salmonella enterica subsp. enterica serovar Thompson]